MENKKNKTQISEKDTNNKDIKTTELIKLFFENNKKLYNKDVPTLNVGFDYGYSYIKAVTIDYNKNELKQVAFPTVIRMTKKPRLRQEEELDYLVEYENDFYSIGERAVQSDGIRNWDKNQSLNEHDFSLMLGAALIDLTKHLDAKEININLALGLPIDFYETQKDKLKLMLNNFKFTITVNNITKNFNIIDSMIMQQAVGAFYSFTTDAFGNIKNDVFQELKQNNGVVATIIDFGYRTTDYLTVLYSKRSNKFTLSDEKSGSIDKGIMNAHQQAKKSIDTEYEIIKDVVFYEDIYIENDGKMILSRKEIDINNYFEDEYKRFSNDIFNDIKKLLDLETSPKNLITGGIATKLKKYIKDDSIEVQDNSLFANAMGYLGKYNLIQNAKFASEQAI